MTNDNKDAAAFLLFAWACGVFVLACIGLYELVK